MRKILICKNDLGKTFICGNDTGRLYLDNEIANNKAFAVCFDDGDYIVTKIVGQGEIVDDSIIDFNAVYFVEKELEGAWNC